MTPEDQDALIEERDLLEREVESLAEQVKLLVRAEHAVTRSRRALDHQLQRIRRLAQYSLTIAGAEDIAEVVAQARAALLDFFEFDDVVALWLTGPEQAVLGDESFARPQIGGQESAVVGRLLEVARRESLGPVAGASSPLVAWVPVRSRKLPVAAVLLAWTSRTKAHHRDLPTTEHLPFLELFGDHVKRALDNAVLTAELRQSNQQLQSSMADLERAHDKLLQAQKLEALGRLAGGIAHDFNNLLGVILGHADLIAPAVSNLPETRDDLAMIVEASRRASAITARLLAFGRQQENKQESLDINALARDFARMIRRVLGDNIRLELQLGEPLEPVYADPVQVEQILLNLVVNARDAMPRGGELIIGTRPARESDYPAASVAGSGRMVSITVSDTGTGIDEATLGQIFEPFFTTKPVGKGSGLGLATVYGLVSQNRGQIGVKSVPGQGARFTVLLPVGTSVAPACDVPVLSQRSAASRGSVIIAEDEVGIRRSVARVLRTSGFDVHEASDGEQALRLAAQLTSLVLVVTDVLMPSMGGPELVERLRLRDPELPVVFISGYTFDRLDIGALDPCRDHFLSKPFSNDLLREAVEQMLSGLRRPSTRAARAG
jgi:signal transduction histidine kinase/ActR/RegA family two-component response regulator